MDADRQAIADALRSYSPDDALGQGLLERIASSVDALKRTARNSIADTLEAPRDFIAMRLRQLGESLPARQGQESIIPGADGGALLARPTMNDWAQNVGMNNGMMAHTVYHGSPHKFDKFDASKIGTGEGAQAYGHGLYFAENPEVAKSYMNAGDARKVGEFTVNGAPMPTDTKPAILVRNALADNKGDKAAAHSWLEEMRTMKYGSATAKDITAAQKLLKNVEFRKPANLYTVDIPDAHIPNMLDWDKPLSQQPEAVRKAVPQAKDYATLRKQYERIQEQLQTLPPISEKFGKLHDKATQLSREMDYARKMESATGADLYNMLGGGVTNQAAASRKLGDLGIPGIRYKDQGSRGSEGGTHNYVVFPGMEHLLQILERK